MMTVHKLSTGDGHLYYTNEVASGDQLRSGDRELGDYYQVTGMPPGQWYGTGVEHFGIDGTVTEAQMDALFGEGYSPRDPATLTAEQNATRAAAVAGVRAGAARSAFETLKLRIEGTPQHEIARTLNTTQKTVSLTLARHTELKNYALAEKALDAGDPEIFYTGYTMTKGEERAAEAAGNRAIETGNEDWINATRLGSKPGEFAQTPANDFTKMLDAEYGRHFRTHDAPPTGKQRKEIQNRVAGAMFRDTHGRDASGVELATFIANNTTPRQQSVAGYDLVFTPTKSVSMAWGLGDANLRTGIEAAHEAAIADVVSYLEEHAIYARRGHGGVEQIDTDRGLVATKFRHYDSRHGDPNLHDHLVVANRVKGTDGKWSTLDGRMIYQYNVAASELYNSRIMHHIHDRLGLEFVPTDARGKQIFELAGITRGEVAAFSARSTSIKETLAEVEAAFIADHGHAPTAKQRIALAQQATLATRPAKEGPHSLAQLNESWRAKAAVVTPNLPTGEALAEHLRAASTARAEAVTVAAAALEATTEHERVAAIIDRLSDTRSTWRASNIEAEALRYYREATGGASADPQAITATVQAVKAASVSMTPALNVPLPTDRQLLRADGSSIYETANREVFTSTGIIASETYLLDAAITSQVIPAATGEVFTTQLDAAREAGVQLSEAQAGMAREFVTSDRLLGLGIGPAGAGKTSLTRLVVDTATASGHQVFGVAPTSAAADVMSDSMGITATTVDAFLMAERSPLGVGDVLMVDEIGMVATPKLAQLVATAEAAGAVVRGVGDDRQLAAIGSGGALRMIDNAAPLPRLEEVYRFRNPDDPGQVNEAEVAASLALREPPATGTDRPFDWYVDAGRVRAGDEETVLREVFTAWVTDTEAGRNSMMIAPTNAQVTALNELAQARALHRGHLETTAHTTTEADVTIYTGDRVVTRRNNRTLALNQGKDFVKNGDIWDVARVHEDGRLTVTHTTHGGTITLPAAYVAQNVELGYAATINRAQGATVDTAHTVLDASTDRAGAYVGATRGQFGNHLYVVTGENSTRDEVLESITGAYETNLSVHEQVGRLRAENRSVAERVGLYTALTDQARSQAMEHAAIEAVGFTRAAQLRAAPAWGALATELANATEAGLEPAALLARAHAQRNFGDSKDDAAVLHWRVKGLRAEDETLRDTTGPRPFAAIPDEHLARLEATARTIQKTAEKPATTVDDPNWHTRPHALETTEHLRSRRAGMAEGATAHDSAEYRWELASIDAELSRRAFVSPTQKAVEEVARGERPRAETGGTLSEGLAQEKAIRDAALPTTGHTLAEQELGTLTHGVSGHTAGTYWLQHQHTPEAMRTILDAHHTDIGELAVLRGKQLATERPAWAEALGEVPANPANAARWYRVAGEVDAYRETYRITDQTPIPKQYAESERGAYLAGQITDVHKRGALSHTPGPDPEQVETTAATATRERTHRETVTPAEVAVTVTTEERTQAVEDLWDVVERDYKAEQGAYTERDAAREALEAARAKLQDSTGQREAIAEQLIETAREDYAPVEAAAARVESANFFTRSAREADYQQALTDYRDQYGQDTPPGRDDEQWLERHHDYTAAQNEVTEDRGQLATAETAAAAAERQAETATATREQSYQGYATARDENPRTRVGTSRMDETQMARATDLQATMDQHHLAAGTRPGEARENSRAAAARAPRPSQPTDTRTTRSVQQHHAHQTHRRGRSL
ncbi:MobF family relaxase [Kocuria sp. CPCC 204721]|uniref:MobF family relaxase n=1 Tax=Kocuria sp. CPCC 204721 TaxID=3073548 RepID=UPI0034D488B8